MTVAVIVLPIGDKSKLLLVEDLRAAKRVYDEHKSKTIGSIHVIDLDNSRVFNNEVDLADCPYTFSHTRHWCGNDICRDS